MSQTARHARIGLFVLLGVFIAFGSVIYLGSIKLFAREEVVLLYFGESVNGLAVGSPIKFKGVTIGNVSEILITYNQDAAVTESFIPVFAKIDLRRVQSDLGVSEQMDMGAEDIFDQLVLDGLRGRLEMQSFITGQLYIELDYFAKPGAPFRVLQSPVVYKEIPTVPSTLAELGSSASNIMAKLASIDVKGLNDSLRTVLNRLDSKIAALDTEGWNRSILETTELLNEVAGGLEVEPLLTKLESVAENLDALVQRVDGAVDPAVSDYQALLVDLRSTAVQVDRTFARLDRLIAANADVGTGLDSSLLEVREAARAFREFLEFLDRNPRALLTGRNEP